jgi:hypothetical protein
LFFIKKWIIMTSILAGIAGVGAIAITSLYPNTTFKKEEKYPSEKVSVIHRKAKLNATIDSPKLMHTQQEIFGTNQLIQPEVDELIKLPPKKVEFPVNGSFGLVESSKNSMLQSVENQSFTKIEAEGFICFTLVQGTKCGVFSTVDSTDVSIEIENGKLEISGNNENQPNSIIITVVELEKIELSGFCNLSMNSTLNVQEIEIEVNGFSSCQINGEVGNFEAEISGESKLKFTGKCNTMDLEIDGMSKGELTINAAELELEVSGQSSLEMSGDVKLMDAEVSGNSELKAKECVAEKIDIEVGGESKAIVTVTNTLKAEVGGNSGLIYYGNPVTVQKNTIGSSTIKAKK